VGLSYQFEQCRGLNMSDYIKQLLKDYSNLCHKDFMIKYKPEELIKARKLALQDQHKSFIDSQVKTRQSQLIKN
jgi:hypothetical protein